MIRLSELSDHLDPVIKHFYPIYRAQLVFEWYKSKALAFAGFLTQHNRFWNRKLDSALNRCHQDKNRGNISDLPGEFQTINAKAYRSFSGSMWWLPQRVWFCYLRTFYCWWYMNVVFKRKSKCSHILLQLGLCSCDFSMATEKKSAFWKVPLCWMSAEAVRQISQSLHYNQPSHPK